MEMLEEQTSIKSSKAISGALFSLPHRNSISSHDNVLWLGITVCGHCTRVQYKYCSASFSNISHGTKRGGDIRGVIIERFSSPFLLHNPLPFPSVACMTFLTRRMHHSLCGSPSPPPSFLFRVLYLHSDFVGISPKVTIFIHAFGPRVACEGKEKRKKKGSIPWHCVPTRARTGTINQIGFRPFLC